MGPAKLAPASRIRRTAESLQIRLEEASRAVVGYKQQHDDEVEVRDAIIIEAVAADVPVVHIAQWSDLSRPRINQIIAAKWPR
jgi:hypothetical protein